MKLYIYMQKDTFQTKNAPYRQERQWLSRAALMIIVPKTISSPPDISTDTSIRIQRGPQSQNRL